MTRNRVDIITMGCSKNLVDSETLMRLFQVNGYQCFHDSEHPQGEIVVVNTCGFIQDAKQESIDTILQLAQAKERGEIGKLFVMGCLSQRYREQLKEEIPEVDAYYGKFDYKQLITDLGLALSQPSPARCVTTPAHYAYVKVSEGCDRHCAYCAIPIMTGRQQSKPVEEVLEEVRQLVSAGVVEFQVIAQELTAYGLDIYGERRIAQLIDAIADVPGVEWVRLHYAYPTQFPYNLLDVMARRDNVCKYLDVALQHVSDNVLRRMRRHITGEQTREFVQNVRKAVPGIALRTTMMVGFPGETEEDFQQLMEFVEWARFERLGAFAYSEEEGTYAAEHYKDDVPEEVKTRRLDKLMVLQQRISAEIEAEAVGKTFKVVVDRREGDYYVARTQFSSPEVDPEVLVPVETSRKPLVTGKFYNVKVTGAEEFDLYATPII
ncbi:MAG: 30S ribosomal protein S12 methylthiotransferase RimO [Prevotella sp.]|nr:30S ribosomal protein S12 methylthiotransferase RimO [Prevotella sp.]